MFQGCSYLSKVGFIYNTSKIGKGELFHLKTEKYVLFIFSIFALKEVRFYLH